MEQRGNEKHKFIAVTIAILKYKLDKVHWVTMWRMAQAKRLEISYSKWREDGNLEGDMAHRFGTSQTSFAFY